MVTPGLTGAIRLSFFGELKRRNVFRVAGVYTVVGWLLNRRVSA